MHSFTVSRHMELLPGEGAYETHIGKLIKLQNKIIKLIFNKTNDTKPLNIRQSFFLDSLLQILFSEQNFFK